MGDPVWMCWQGQNCSSSLIISLVLRPLAFHPDPDHHKHTNTWLKSAHCAIKGTGTVSSHRGSAYLPGLEKIGIAYGRLLFEPLAAVESKLGNAV